MSFTAGPTAISHGVPVASVSAGIALFIRDDLGPNWSSILAAWDMFASDPLSEGLGVYTHSAITEWRPFDRRWAAEIRRELARVDGRRPFWRFRVADTHTLPAILFDLADMRPTRDQPRTSWLNIRLPLETSSTRLRDLALKLVDLLPIHVGTAGYMFGFREQAKPLAFDQIWAWARRFWGIEVVDLEQASWDTVRGPVSVNWLTVVDRGLAQGKVPDAASLGSYPKLVVHRSPRSLTFQATDEPTFGDRNHFEDVGGYVAAAQVLEPVLVRPSKDFVGMFTDHKSTARWAQRFLEPERWIDADLP
jgi:hypothetical protein